VLIARAAVLAALVVLGMTAAGAAQGAPAPVVIYVRNDATNLSDAGVADALTAFQRALDEDFSPYWNVTARLVFAPGANRVPAGAPLIDLRNYPEYPDYPSCLSCSAYHGIHNGTPYAVVATRVSDPAGWQIDFSHELFEMLVNPRLDRAGFASPFKSRFTPVALEVCDPVPSWGYGFWVTSEAGVKVRVSDFVTEQWFSGQGGSKLDFTGVLRHAGRVARHGYILHLPLPNPTPI
jgi:hypothetical protein